MRVVDAPPLGPGCCAITGTDKGRFIDTLIDDDTLRPGRIYIAEDAVVTMAEMFGMKTELAFVRIKNKAERLEVELREAQAELAELRTLRDAVISAAENKEPVHAS